MVGRALRAELTRREIEFDWTSRRRSSDADMHLNLLNLPLRWPEAPLYQVAYIAAAVPKFADCEGDRATWLVNADAPVRLAKLLQPYGIFVVFISSDVVEYAGGTAYARQKAYAEAYLQTTNAAIVRPSRIAPEHARSFADFLFAVGNTRHAGLVRWTRPIAPDEKGVAYG